MPAQVEDDMLGKIIVHNGRCFSGVRQVLTQKKKKLGSSGGAFLSLLARAGVWALWTSCVDRGLSVDLMQKAMLGDAKSQALGWKIP